MTRKTTKSGSISRRRLLTTASAGAALAVSPLRINLLRAQEANIKIGFPVPLTGPYGTEAQDQVRAGQLAVAQFNDGGGLNGRKAELVVRDDKLNPGEAATRTLELVEKEKVNFVVGSLSAAVQLAINNVTKERGIIFNSISQSDTINEASDFSRFLALETSATGLLAAAVDRMGLSVRAVHRALRVARTIADLEMSQAIDPKHLAEALGYRSRVFGEESDRLDRAPLSRLPSMATQAQAVKQLGLSKPRSKPA